MMMRDYLKVFVREEQWGQLLLDLERDRAWALPASTFPPGTQVIARNHRLSPLFADNPFSWDGTFRLGLESTQVFPLTAPLSISWSVTNRCNCSCVFCCNDSGAHCNTDELSFSEICACIDILKEWNIFRVIIGGGEPFCRKDILQVLDHFRRSGIRPALATNATMVKEEHLPLIAQTCMSLQISLDTLQPGLYKKMRGVDALPHVLNIIKKASGMVNVRVVTVLNRDNFNELDQIASYLHRIGVRQWFLFALLPSGRGAGVWKALHVDETLAKERISALTRQYPDMCIWYWGNSPGDGISTYIEPDGSFALVDYHSNTRRVFSNDEISLAAMQNAWKNVSLEAQSASVRNFTSANRALAK